jgi:crotonobetainyl-CoA:carnitine CoA-transferase CaiB-like acyl-CoA transferase
MRSFLVEISERGKRQAVARHADGGLPLLYKTRDGRQAVGALERKFWETLCDILGCAELKGKHIVYGKEARPVKERLAAIFATRAQREWSEVFANADCCVSPVLKMDETLADEQVRSRGMVVAQGGLMQFAPPAKFSEFEFAISRPAPEPGEHTDEILGEAGYDKAQIDALRVSGVI